MTRKVFENGIGTLIELFPSRDFSLDVYWTFLRYLKDEDFLHGISEIICATEILGPSTNLIALIRKKAIIGNKAISGDEAFGIVMKQVLSVGSYGTPSFDNLIIEKAVDYMGWRDICLSEDKDRQIIRSQFVRLYETLLRREEVDKISLAPTAIGHLIKGALPDVAHGD